jgi:hypothetical protein
VARHTLPRLRCVGADRGRAYLGGSGCAWLAQAPVTPLNTRTHAPNTHTHTPAGQNKIVHIAHMNSSGYSFVVLSNAFVIHRAHEQTTMRLMLVGLGPVL